MTREEILRQINLELEYSDMIKNPFKYLPWADYSSGYPVLNRSVFETFRDLVEYGTLTDYLLCVWTKQSVYADGTGDEVWDTCIGSMCNLVSILYYPAECRVSFSEMREEGGTLTFFASSFEEVERIRIQVAIQMFRDNIKKKK